MLSEKIDYASSKLTCNNELALLVRVAVVSPLPKNRQIFRGPEYSPGSYLLNSRTIISSKTILNPPNKPATTKIPKTSGLNLNSPHGSHGYYTDSPILGGAYIILIINNNDGAKASSLLFYPSVFPLCPFSPMFFSTYCLSLACSFLCCILTKKRYKLT